MQNIISSIKNSIGFNFTKTDKFIGSLFIIDDPDLFYIDKLSDRIKKTNIKTHISDLDIKNVELSTLYDINIKQTLSEDYYNSLKHINYSDKLDLIYNMKLFHTHKNILTNSMYNETEWICIIQNMLNVSDNIFKDIKSSIDILKDTEWDIIIIGKKDIVKCDIDDKHTNDYINYKMNNMNNMNNINKNTNLNHVVKILEFRGLEGYIIKTELINKIINYFDKMENKHLCDTMNKLIEIYNLKVFSLI